MSLVVLARGADFVGVGTGLRNGLVGKRHDAILRKRRTIRCRGGERRRRSDVIPSPAARVAPGSELAIAGLGIRRARGSPNAVGRRLSFAVRARRMNSRLCVGPVLFPRLRAGPFVRASQILPIRFPCPCGFALLYGLTLPRNCRIRRLPRSRFVQTRKSRLRYECVIRGRKGAVLIDCEFRLGRCVFLPRRCGRLRSV